MSADAISRTGKREWRPKPTLPGRAYHAADVWDDERERIFGREWICVGREEELPEPSSELARSVAGDVVHLTCDPAGGLQAVVGSRRAALDTWHGFVFVNLGSSPEPLLAYVARNHEGDLTDTLARWSLADLRIGHRIDYDIAANWKILIENYSECLHCPGVHPELVKLVPEFRTGMVEDDVGAILMHGAATLTLSGTTTRPPIPGLAGNDLHVYLGNTLFPTLLINLHPDCVMTYRLEPVGPTRTRIVSEFLFHPQTMARDDFDPSDIAGFWDLVSGQDWAVCERAQLGVGSRAYANGGVYPFNDYAVAAFNDRYRASMA